MSIYICMVSVYSECVYEVSVCIVTVDCVCIIMMNVMCIVCMW